ncbi:MAG: FliI/YscN family ATPase, partial [Armatimonadetes bacterium]|nr:FliI/YscN family ATPase [Armatimonadota bacterium]
MDTPRPSLLTALHRVVDEVDLLPHIGQVTRSVGLIVESNGPPSRVGDLCEIRADGHEPVRAEVVGFRGHHLVMMPLGHTENIAMGSEVVASEGFSLWPGPGMLGRVLDGLGQPLDGRPLPRGLRAWPVMGTPPAPLERQRIREVLPLGVRALDGLLTCGRGQRLGIFAGAGVGKSTLLGMIARRTRADVNVIGLIGERGREVREFIERDLGPEGLARSVIVAATGDQPPLVRIKAAHVATAIAEHFRDQGRHVLLMMDSVTRFAWAQREVGLASGEPPTRNGYTPSVFAALPRLLERAGSTERGSVTGLYTVLVEGDDLTDPAADAARSILDGHVVLSRKLTARGYYPAIYVSASVSRLMPDLVPPEHLAAAQHLRQALSDHEEAEDLINLGAYVAGSNPRL